MFCPEARTESKRISAVSSDGSKIHRTLAHGQEAPNENGVQGTSRIPQRVHCREEPTVFRASIKSATA
jgi:hypothetical protein